MALVAVALVVRWPVCVGREGWSQEQREQESEQSAMGFSSHPYYLQSVGPLAESICYQKKIHEIPL